MPLPGRRIGLVEGLNRSARKGIPRSVRHEVAGSKWLIHWKSAVASMT